MKESDLFEPIKDWLEERGWEVFAEVSGYEGIADIVGRQRKMYCIVEMKTSLSHEVIDQAIRWVGYVHYIYIAIPKRKSAIPRYLEQLFREKGIGVLEVGKIDYSGLYNSEKYLLLGLGDFMKNKNTLFRLGVPEVHTGHHTSKQ